MNEPPEGMTGLRRVAFLGDYVPRKCGIATFTSDLLTAVTSEYPRSECFSVPVNDVKGGYEYPDVVRFEIEEQDLASGAGARWPISHPWPPATATTSTASASQPRRLSMQRMRRQGGRTR